MNLAAKLSLKCVRKSDALSVDQTQAKMMWNKLSLCLRRIHSSTMVGIDRGVPVKTNALIGRMGTTGMVGVG